jgi:hypothetical protein
MVDLAHGLSDRTSVSPRGHAQVQVDRTLPMYVGTNYDGRRV